MKDTLLWLVQQLVDTPDEVTIEESGTADRAVLTIHVAAADMGKIIGKHGRIIRAIRDLTKLLATKRGTYVDVVLAEEKASEV